MVRNFVVAAALASFPLSGMAQDLNGSTSELPTSVSATTGAGAAEETTQVLSTAGRSRNMSFTVRGGIGAGPEYFGSKHMDVGPDFAINFGYVRLPGGLSFGSPDPDARQYGFSPRGSFRVIRKRKSSKYNELEGMDNVDLSVEVGIGIGYNLEHFEAYADARYGVIGHHAFVGELGANYVVQPIERLVVKAGPRVFLGDNKFASTYFGVKAREAAANQAAGGRLTQHDADGGALAAGFELSGVYKLNENWGLDGAVRYDRYLGDAKSSPIVKQGSKDQVTVRLGLTRRFSF